MQINLNSLALSIKTWQKHLKVITSLQIDQNVKDYYHKFYKNSFLHVKKQSKNLQKQKIKWWRMCLKVDNSLWKLVPTLFMGSQELLLVNSLASKSLHLWLLSVEKWSTLQETKLYNCSQDLKLFMEIQIQLWYVSSLKKVRIGRENTKLNNRWSSVGKQPN